MSKWQKIVKNGWFPKIVAECYRQFPVEVRAKLAFWFEERESWLLNIDPLNPANHAGILLFLREMVSQFENSPCQLPPIDPNNPASFLYRYQIEEAHRRILETLKLNVGQVTYFQVIQTALATESKTARELELGSLGGSVNNALGNSEISGVAPSEKEMFLQLDAELRTDLENLTGNRLPWLEVQLKRIDSEYTQILNADPNKVEMQKKLLQLSQCVRHFYKISSDLKPEIDVVFDKVRKELQLFKDEQRLISLGRKPVRDIEVIDNWWGSVADCLALLADSLRLLCFLSQNLCSDLYDGTVGLQNLIENKKKEMIRSSLVIEVQPKPVVRIDTFFGHPVKLRVLRSSNNMSIQSVDQKLLYQSGAERAAKADFNEPEDADVAGSVVWKRTSHPKIKSSTVEYKELKIQKVTRTTKRNINLVVEEKFYVLFQVMIKVDGEDYKLSAVSLRLSVTSHPNQEGDAWGIIIWENAMETMKNKGVLHRVEWRSPPSSSSSPAEYEDVSWSSLIESINYKFLALGRELTEKNKIYIMKKLFRGKIPPCHMVNWQTFARDAFVEVDISLLDMDQKKYDGQKKPTAPTKIFTFWEWLWECIELLEWRSDDLKKINHSLRILWQDGKMEGFMSEEDIKASLSSVKKGNFIIRFPEGRPESIGVYTLDAYDRIFKMTYPKSELEKLSLQDRITTNLLLLYLYPDKKKKEEFARSSSQDAIINGYIAKIELKENFSGNIAGNSSPPHVDWGVPSPASSHSFHSYNSQFTQSSSEEHSTSTGVGNQSDPTFSFTAMGNVSLIELGNLCGSSANFASGNYGVDNAEVMNWVDGVAASILNV